MLRHLCRNLHLANIRMWAGDYTLSGLVGFEVRSKTIGVLGTGAIGAAACRIFAVRCSAFPARMRMPPHLAVGSTQCRGSMLIPSTMASVFCQAQGNAATMMPGTACSSTCQRVLMW
jgi:hypothetical protein